MINKKAFVKKHPYKIWKGVDGSWYTYFLSDKPGKKRILKKRSTQQKLLDDIVFYWENEEVNPTIESCAPHSRYFSDELGAPIFEGKNQNRHLLFAMHMV